MQIIGYGGFGREIEAYCNKNDLHVQIFKNHEDAKLFSNKRFDAVIAIGNEEVRRQIVDELEDNGNVYVSWGVLNFGYIYGGKNIGGGTIICPNTILTTNVTLGLHCLVNISCTIGHDVTVGDFVTINPGVNISGNVTIGSNCNIGSNAVIRNGISICDDVVIGAGSVVVKDITEPGIYVGSPAVRLDKRPKYAIEIDLKMLKHDVDLLIKYYEESKVVKATDTVSIRMTNKNKKE